MSYISVGQPNGPVSIYWDIENVAIPTGDNVFDVVLKLRKRLIEDRNLWEGTFKTYCGSNNSLPQQHLADFHHSNVQTEYIGSTKHGVMDFQILKDLQRFREQHKSPATVVLISGDVDFIKHLNELRYRDRHYTIIIHNPQAKAALLKTANEAIPWTEFVERKYTVKKVKTLPKQIKPPQPPSIPKPKHRLAGAASPKHNRVKPRPSDAPSKRSTLMESNVDQLAANTDDDDNASKSTSLVAHEGATGETPAVVKKKKAKNKNKYVLTTYPNISSI